MLNWREAGRDRPRMSAAGWCIIVAFLISGCGKTESSTGTVMPSAAETENATPTIAAAESNAPATESAPQLGKLDPRLVWNSDQLFEAEVNHDRFNQMVSLRQTPIMNLYGLAAFRLEFVLPPRNLRAWSADGKILYVYSIREQTPLNDGSTLKEYCLMRIDSRSWETTHQITFSEARDAVEGVVVTSLGVVVALRNVVLAETSPFDQYALQHRVIDARTGKTYEKISYRRLVVLDPDTLEVRRSYIGPARLLAGSPMSPVVCVTDDNSEAKLIDLRSGKVLDVAGGDSTAQQPKVWGFDEMLMSPDGKTLYHRGTKVHCTDISTGKFVARENLEPTGDPADVLPSGPPTLHLSHDGKLLAVRTEDNVYNVDRYSIVETNPRGEPETEHPLGISQTTDFGFAGKNNRPVFNGANHGPDNYDKFDLVVERKKYALHNDISLASDFRDLATLCGVPRFDHVLVSNRKEATLLVRLPPDTRPVKSTGSLTVEALRDRSITPEQPLKFVKRKPKSRFDVVRYPGLEVPDNTNMACSYDGSRLYLISATGMLHMFDTETLSELRRVQVEKREEAYYQLQVSKHGPLVREQTDIWYRQYNGESLDGMLKFRLDPNEELVQEIGIGAGSDAVAFRSKAGDLNVCRILDGKLIERVTKRQLKKLNPTSSERGINIEYLTINDEGTYLACRYGDWHAFELSDSGLQHRGAFPGPRRAHDGSVSGLFALPEIGLAYLLGERSGYVRLLRLPEFTDTERTIEFDRCECQAITRHGLIYVRRAIDQRDFELKLIVLDKDGQQLFEEAVFQQKWDTKVLPLPHRPTRVFMHYGNEILVADLESEDD